MKEKQNQKGKQNKKEKGITLIALIITIALLLILAGIAIKTITGEANLIENTETVAKDYNIKSYQEEIKKSILETILEKASIGEEASLQDIGEALKEKEGIKEIQTNLSQTDTNDDILMLTKEGYIFQAYHQNSQGKTEVEYVGNSKNKNLENIPKLKASYQNGSIVCTANIEEGNITKLELIYQGKTETKNNINGETTFKIENKNTGWYTIKATSNENKQRYAWINIANITDKIQAPKIEIIGNPEIRKQQMVHKPAKHHHQRR